MMFESYLAGIIAAFTPCVVVLFPLVLYRFFQKEDKQWLKFTAFIAGFIISFIIFGYSLQGLLSSSFQNGFKLGLGLTFTILGIMAFIDRINPLNIPVIKQPILLGAIFALVLSFSPCTIPYLGIIITLGGAGIFSHILLFAAGMITPAIIFAIIGQKMLTITNNRMLKKTNKIMSLVLAITGIYLAATITSFGIHDAYIVALMLFLIFVLMIKAFFIIHTRKDFLKPRNILLLLALTGIIIATLIHCTHETKKDISEKPYSFVEETGPVCYENIQDCKICTRCAVVFGIATLAGLLAILLLDTKNRKNKKTKNRRDIKS